MNAYKVVVEDLLEDFHLEDRERYGRIILKWIFRETGCGWNLHRIVLSGGLWYKVC